MNILHLHHSCDPSGGGPIELTMQLGLEWARGGHQVEWASLDAPDSPWIGDFGLPLHPLGLRKPGGYGFSPRLLPWLRANRSRFDAVMVHGLWQYHGRAAHRALRGTDTPYFVMPHGMLDPWFKRAHPLKHLKKSIYWRLAQGAVLRDARAVVFTCEEERRLAQNTFYPYSACERVVVAGTRAPEGDPAAWRELFFQKFPALREKRILLFLARLHPKKGCDLLLEAFARASGPLHLVIAGPGGGCPHAEKLRRLAAGLPVTFTGMLDREAKWGALSAAEAFILTSHQENFGMAVAEALAAGTPVLISNKVNIWREIEAGRAGLVEQDDLPGATRLLERWLGADHAAMRQAACLCFAARFDIRKSAENMLAVLQT
jgi:glycosyltransferase involved in cell wall biosynthesis